MLHNETEMVFRSKTIVDTAAAFVCSEACEDYEIYFPDDYHGYTKFLLLEISD